MPVLPAPFVHSLLTFPVRKELLLLFLYDVASNIWNQVQEGLKREGLKNVMGYSSWSILSPSQNLRVDWFNPRLNDFVKTKTRPSLVRPLSTCQI